MNKRLFVGGLSYTINDAQLKDLFAQFGTVVSANVITDRFTGQSKGFGFVEMSTDEETEKAIQGLNGTEIEGRKISVDIAKPREERPRRDFSGGRSDYSRGGNSGNSRGNRGRQGRW